MTETGISALVERMRDAAVKAIADWEEPDHLSIEDFRLLGACNPSAILALISDWEKRGKERDEAIEARNAELMKQSLWETFEQQSAALADAVNERDTLSARVAELEQALEPFAAVADHVRDSRKDGDVLLGYDGEELTAGQFRRARAVLAHKPA